MSEVLLVKQASLDGFTEAEKIAVRKFLFQAVDGHGRNGKTLWRRLWGAVTKAEVGEVFKLAWKRDRSGPYHRRTMAILSRVFDAQERFDNDERFLDWVKIGAGHCVWAAGPRGGIVPLPKSISYAEADQDEFMQFHAGAMAFFRGEHAAKYLWPNLNPTQRVEMVDVLLGEFQE